jgi:hypothetical protein
MAVAEAARDETPRDELTTSAWWSDHPGWLLFGVGALLSIPIVVALVVLHSPRWFPLLDWAQTEIRIRDIVSGHPPLIGLAGRIGPFGANGGSHPGPLSFYVLWPFWALWGQKPYGMQFGTGVLDITAIALSLWMGYRRGGLRVALVVALVLVVLMRAYGAFLLTLPWNPYLPVMWWFVFLIAMWSVLCDDFAMLPIAVLAGTFCMQTHISYLGLVAGVIGFVGVVLVVFLLMRWKQKDARNAILVWGLTSLALLLVLWVPPVIEQVVHDPGNLSTIQKHFSNPPDPPIGFGQGVKVLLSQLNGAKIGGAALVKDGTARPVEGAVWPGVLLLIAWVASVAVAFWKRVRTLIWLDVVIGVALLLGVFSAARIFGDVWFYLVLWAITLNVLMLMAILWAIAAAIGKNLERPLTARALVVAVSLIAIVAGIFTVNAARVNVMSPRLNAQLAALTPPTIATLKQMERDGQRGPYLVTWLPEAQGIGAEGYGLLNEMLRYNLDAKADEVFRPGATRYHVIDRAKTTMQVHLATGVDIERWRRDPRFHEVAYYDPKSPTELAEFNALHQQVVDELQREGLSAHVHEVDDNLLMLSLLPSVPADTRAKMSKMLAYGLPAAVFVGPVADPATP